MGVLNIRNVSNIATLIVASAPRPNVFEAAASSLGISRKELRSQLDAGESISSLAGKRGKNVDEVRQAMLKAVPGADSAKLSKKVDDLLKERSGPRSGENVELAKKQGLSASNPSSYSVLLDEYV